MCGSCIGAIRLLALRFAATGSEPLSLFLLRSIPLCLAAHADEFIDQRIDWLLLPCLATHPNERIEKVVERLSL